MNIEINFKQLELIFTDIKFSKFKDRCDKCNEFHHCKGYNGKVLCQKCIKKMNE